MKVELRPAIIWTCDNCCKDNYEQTGPAEFTDEEAIELRKQLDINTNYQGVICEYPETVVCQHCLSQFETELMEH